MSRALFDRGGFGCSGPSRGMDMAFDAVFGIAPWLKRRDEPVLDDELPDNELPALPVRQDDEE